MSRRMAWLAFTASSIFIFAACGGGSSGTEIGQATTVPATTSTTALDSDSGPIGTSSGSQAPATTDASPEVPNKFASCEAALEVNEDCSQTSERAFQKWGDNLSRLAADPDLGIFNDTGYTWGEVNEAALYACQFASQGESEYVWLDTQFKIYKDLNGNAHEKLFDAAMTYICPELNVDRQDEWDTYVPAADTGGGTQATTATIATSDGPKQYTCTDVAYWDSSDPNDTCSESLEGLFATIIQGSPDGFTNFITSGELGIFDGQDYGVAETSSVGFLVCVSIASGDSYADFEATLLGAYPEADAASAQKVYATAQRDLCG